MTTALQHYLHEHIPLAGAMQVHVDAISTHALTLSAPLAPNINHRDSLFGGSASAVAILAAWAYLHNRVRQQGLSPTLVIQRNSMTYDQPVLGDFSATARLVDEARWPVFLRMLQRRGKARIAVASVLEYDTVAAGHFSGDFVAVLR